MNILLLSVGDGESWRSWSGSTKSLVDHLRKAGHSVTCRNVDLHGLRRLKVALVSYSPDKRRWGVRYHLGRRGFEERSRVAQEAVQGMESRIDAVIQIGATFRVSPRTDLPVVLYCDSNIKLSRAGAIAGVSEASTLTERELREIEDRETQVYENADRIYCMSDRLRASFVSEFGIPEHRVETAYPGPNFPIGEAPVVPQRDRGCEPVILFIGRDFERKGGELLLHAFSEVRAAVPGARLLIVGPDSIPLASGDSRWQGVELLGFLDKESPKGQESLYEAYRSAGVFCLPTRFEPFGIVFLEAMYYQLPCVGPNAWAIPEIIHDGETGLLFASDDASELATSLIKILGNPLGSRGMGSAGARRLDSEFSWRAAAEKIVAGIEALSERDARPGGVE